MVAIDAYTPGHRLAWLARRLTQLDRPYLITGPQAAYEYHRWLTPLENVATLQVYTEDVPIWRQVNGEGCQVFETPPTTAQVQAVKEGIILDPTLEAERYRRRRVIGGLTFIAPEDLCMDLVERARGETSPAEAVAIIIAQRKFLAWDLLLDQAGQRGLARRLGALLEAINVETVSVVPSEVIEKLRRRVDSVHTPPETTTYPAGRHRAIPFAYQPIAERWGLRLVLPRYVIGKVALDLQAQQG